MISILDEIYTLRKSDPIIDYKNTSRYRLVTQEKNGSRTAYYFSCPIYNIDSRKLIDLCFEKDGETIYLKGSNANITVLENIRMGNSDGFCIFDVNERPGFVSENELSYSGNRIFPTTNGIAIKAAVNGEEPLNYTIEVGEPFLEIRANDKYFSLMKETFRPFVTVSCIGSADAADNIIAPAQIAYQRIADRKYQLSISATSPFCRYVFFEVNLYENKLFQDTTVESMNPSVNNAFGGTGFIGNTSKYGEQWLYSRPDYTKLSDIEYKLINKAVLHMPKFNKNSVDLSAVYVKARFCSFGSNWNNKIDDGNLISDSYKNGRYQSIDLTPLLVDKRTFSLRKSDGLIMRSKIKGSGFSTVSTGDSCYAPQILEVNYS